MMGKMLKGISSFLSYFISFREEINLISLTFCIQGIFKYNIQDFVEETMAINIRFCCKFIYKGACSSSLCKLIRMAVGNFEKK